MPSKTVKQPASGSIAGIDADASATVDQMRRTSLSRQLPNLTDSEKFCEVIETHFVYDKAIYFVVLNKIIGEQAVKNRESSAKIAYAVKPLWYVAGTPAMVEYEREINAKDRIYLKDRTEVLVAEGVYPKRSFQRRRAAYTGVVKKQSGYPKAKTSTVEYQLHIPDSWGQLAHYRLLHHNIDRILACAEMKTNSSEAPCVTVYIVRWQNEPLAELVPIEYLHKSARHQHHHVAFNYWEDATVLDCRHFRSAGSIDYFAQKDAGKAYEDETFSVLYLHCFKARQMWTDSYGRASKTKAKLAVQWFVGWPLTMCEVVPEPEDKVDLEKAHDEDDAEDPADESFDEYVEARTYDKFTFNNNTNAFDFSAGKLSSESIEFKNKSGATVEQCMHVPPKWRQLGEDLVHTDTLDSILCAFKQGDLACVYVTKWANYPSVTITKSLTLRKRYSTEMLGYWVASAFLPVLSLEKKE